MRRALWAALTVLSSAATAENYLGHSPDAQQNWGVSLSADGYRWDMEGSFVNVGKLSSNAASSFSGTGDSLGLDREVIGQFSVVASNRRWNLGLYHLPVSYSGSGFGLTGVVVGPVVGLVKTDVVSDVNLDFLVGEITYNLIATDTSLLSLGFGAGKLDLDVQFDVESGSDFDYQRTDPYGYLILNVQNRLDRFFYGFTVNGVKFHGEDSAAEDIDYKVKFAYRLLEGNIPVDIHGGWRHMRLKLEIDESDSATNADIELKGPYLGVGVTF